MDQSYPNARNITLKLRFVKNNETLFYGFDWYWFNTGVMTAYKQQSMTFEENWRSIEYPYYTILQWIEDGVIPQVFIFRDLLSQQPPISWDDALYYVNTVFLASPMYVIMASLNGYSDGAIITRGINDTVYYNFYNISNSTDPTWYMVQTNYDHWLPDPPDDDRRTIAQNLISQWNQSADCQDITIGANIFGVLSTYSVGNQDTLYTAIMSPSNDVFLTYIMEGMVPYFQCTQL